MSWCTLKMVTEEKGFYSDLYKEQTGIRPRTLTDEELVDYMNGAFTLNEDNEIVERYK